MILKPNCSPSHCFSVRLNQVAVVIPIYESGGLRLVSGLINWRVVTRLNEQLRFCSGKSSAQPVSHPSASSLSPISSIFCSDARIFKPEMLFLCIPTNLSRSCDRNVSSSARRVLVSTHPPDFHFIFTSLDPFP